MADFSKKQGGVQGVGPNTKAPSESGTPVTGFTEAPHSEREASGPGEGIPANTRKIK